MRAFVEIIEVPLKDKQAARRRRRVREAQVDGLRASLDARLFEQALAAMEQAAAGDPSSVPAEVGPPSQKDLDAVRAGLEKARAKAAAKTARARSLERALLDESGRERTTRWYRLHTEFEHLEWSEAKFARLAGTQQSWPVRVAASGRVRWWWYLDRFWAEDEGLDAQHVRARVLDDAREQIKRRRAQQRALQDALSSVPERVEAREPTLEQAARGAVARCVECGSGENVVFDSTGGDIPVVELRCVRCRSLRLRAERAANGHTNGASWRHEELAPLGAPVAGEESPEVELEPEPESESDPELALALPSVWVVSPGDIRSRSSS